MTSFGGSVSPLNHEGSNRQMLQGDRLQAQSSHLNLRAAFASTSDIFKFFGGSKKVTRDGKPAKRRGPKPDSKPALTRRQQLNRQAQRSHRERKAQYIKTLETDISSLREAYFEDITAANASIQQNREISESLKKENGILKQILSAHGIPFEAEIERLRANRPATALYLPSPPSASSPGYSASAGTGRTLGSNSQAYPGAIITPDSSPRTTRAEHIDGSRLGPPGKEQPFYPQTTSTYQMSPNEQFDYMDRDRSNQVVEGTISPHQPVPAIQGVFEEDPQLQVDFILTLESPCREHTDYLCRQSDDDSMPYSGHTLMASCPPPSYISRTTSDQTYPHKTYDLPPANLMTLLNLSRQLVTDGQITPIMALQCLRTHEMYPTLTRDDVRVIVETLNTKIRCYGFGAVLEDFELMDCLNSVLGMKGDCAGVSALNGNGNGGMGDYMMYT